MQICLEYTDSVCRPTRRIAGAYSRNPDDPWCVKEESHASNMFHHFLMEFIFSRGNYPQKARKSPQKVRKFPQKVRKSGFLHHWKSGFNKILSAGWLTFNLTISGLEGARIEKKCRNVCRGVCEIKWSGAVCGCTKSSSIWSWTLCNTMPWTPHLGKRLPERTWMEEAYG